MLGFRRTKVEQPRLAALHPSPGKDRQPGVRAMAGGFHTARRRLTSGSHWMRAVCGGGITSPKIL